MKWTPRALPWLLLALPACGGDAPAPPGPAAAPPDSVSGVAREGDRTMRAGWGVAFWNPEKRELKIGFLAEEPSAEMMQQIQAIRGLVNARTFGVPLTQATFRFSDQDPPGAAGITSYVMTFFDFSGEPMSINENGAKVREQIDLTGDLRPGGRIAGRFHGSSTWTFDNERRSFEWDLAFELTVR